MNTANNSYFVVVEQRRTTVLDFNMSEFDASGNHGKNEYFDKNVTEVM